MIEEVFPRLPAQEVLLSTGARKIAVASVDIAGPYHGGGVGAAYLGLALALADSGHDVTILYLHHQFHQGDATHWTSYFRARGVRFVHLPQDASGPVWYGNRKSISLRCYRWLREQPAFDVIHFPEWQGVPYYSLLGKKLGLAFAGTTICVGTHGPMRWSRQGDQVLVSRAEDLVLDFMERKSVELADVVVSPSQYLLNWLRDDGWHLPEKSYVANNVLQPMEGRPAAGTPSDCRIRELVFFGRLDRRKGLPFFFDALEMLPAGSFLATLLGSNALIDEKPSIDYIRSRCATWKTEPLVLTSLSRTEALEYLYVPGRLAVIPSQMDNSPCTVQECLEEGIPFLASNRGGIPEMVHPGDRDRVTAPLELPAFVARLQEILHSGQRPARAAAALSASREQWCKWHEGFLPLQVASLPISIELPFISICIAHYERPHLLEQMLDSIRHQTYSRLEVIVVDDGSISEESRSYLNSLTDEFASRKWQLLRQHNAGPGAARNRAAEAARGSYLLFADDDDVLLRHAVETFARAAVHSGADALSCVLMDFEGTRAPTELDGAANLLIPLGPALAASLISPEVGGTLYLLRRDCYFAIGGFPPDRDADEDWELLLNVVVNGFDLQVIPEPLVWYRKQTESRSRADNRAVRNRRRLEIYERMLPPTLRDLAPLAFGRLSHAADAGRVFNILEKLRKQRLEEASSKTGTSK